VNEEVVGAGDVHHPQDLRHGEALADERVGKLARVRAHAHADDRLLPAPDALERHLGVEALDHAARHQTADALGARRGGDARVGGQRLDGPPSVLLQAGQDPQVDRIKFGGRAHPP